MYPYEAMFLVDPAMHGADPEAVENTVKGLLEKHGARIHEFEKWDERRLAYEIQGRRRGVYLLVHFELPGEAVDDLRGDCKLTESILRQLVIRLEDDIPTHLEKCARYHEIMRADQEGRRGERGREGADEFAPSEPHVREATPE
ncbi:MAG: 30S ribosomal protein S6 [Planctomycetota bacterium]|jgi:small subunit ribosomal protein S6